MLEVEKHSKLTRASEITISRGRGRESLINVLQRVAFSKQPAMIFPKSFWAFAKATASRTVEHLSSFIHLSVDNKH